MDKKIKKSLRYSLFDGIFASIMIGASETFIIPYAIAMKAGARLVGAISAAPNLAGALLQLGSVSLSDRIGSRKTVTCIAVLIHALMWIPVIAIPYVFKDHMAVYLLVFYAMLVAIGLVSFPPWSSMMADHVPETERGKVFGRRNRVFGVTNICSMLLAGLLLHAFRNSPSGAFTGFTIIFTIAFISRVISWKFLTKMYEPPLHVKPEHRFTMRAFLKRIRRSNFGRFVMFVATVNFAVYMASPFFAVYMLRDLHFNYLIYTVVIMTATLTIFLMMKVWGSRADLVGNRRVLRLTSYFIPFVPILWLFSQNVAYLVAIQVFAGFFWAGFNLSASNFIYDAVTPEKRTRCIAYYNVINGIAIFSGAMTGGFLAKCLPPIFGSRLLSLFLLSGLLRFAALPICSTIKEVRQVKHVSSLELFYSIMTARPPTSLYSNR